MCKKFKATNISKNLQIYDLIYSHKRHVWLIALKLLWTNCLGQ
jgi:hypothetical protein